VSGYNTNKSVDAKGHNHEQQSRRDNFYADEGITEGPPHPYLGTILAIVTSRNKHIVCHASALLVRIIAAFLDADQIQVVRAELHLQ
jgi:hypothetical protein